MTQKKGEKNEDGTEVSLAIYSQRSIIDKSSLNVKILMATSSIHFLPITLMKTFKTPQIC